MHFLVQILHDVTTVHYGNIGCGVFKRGVRKLERFLIKNQHTQRKLLNFENWISGGPKKFFKNQSFKSQLFSSSQKEITSN